MEHPQPIGAVEDPNRHPHICSRKRFLLLEAVAMPIMGTRTTFHFAARPEDQMRALLNHRQTLLQLAQTGGVTWPEMAAILLDRENAPSPDPELCRAACARVVAELADRIAHD